MTFKNSEGMLDMEKTVENLEEANGDILSKL